jgi:hypothetical protein
MASITASSPECTAVLQGRTAGAARVSGGHVRAQTANAKARGTEQYNKGNLSAAQRAQINAKANAKLKTC